MDVFINAIGALMSREATPLATLSVIVVCVLAFFLLRRYRRTQIILEKIDKIDDERKFQTLKEDMRSDSLKKFADILEASQTLGAQEKAQLLREVVRVHYGMSLRSFSNWRIVIIAVTIGSIIALFSALVFIVEFFQTVRSTSNTLSSIVDSLVCGGSIFC